MDMNLLREISTVLGLMCFALIVIWAFGTKNGRKKFDDAAQQIILDDDIPKQRDNQ